MPEPTTHDFGPGKRCWGHDYSITKVVDSGQRLHVTGWGPRMKEGDFMLLANRGRETRYRIAAYEPVMDPTDMWHAVLDFAPRQAA
ncbi:hypothetical protein AB0M92_19240 [Streptomyces sp. NPDC051582]|uniref:hypothetical protein n=1 Tax=Streptomyces sp. NPDC051582 TaxID=3155167 RepID=UPI00343A23DC